MLTQRHRSRQFDEKFFGYSGDNLTTVSGDGKQLISEEMTDVEIPDFHKKLKSGIDLPVNPMSQVKTKIVSPPCKLAHERFDTTGLSKTMEAVSGHLIVYSPVMQASGRCYANIATYGLTKPSWPNQDALLQQALANAKQDGWDVATYLAEFNKTLGLIAGVALRVRKRAEKILRSKTRKIKTYEEFLDAWLEYRYGWRILAYDLMDIQRSLDVLSGRESMPRRWTSHDTRSNYAWQRASVLGPYFAVPDGEGNVKGYKSSSLVTADLLYERSYTREIRAGVGLTLKADVPFSFDPLVTAWEVIPFSFIADWFFNFGEAIGAWSPFGKGELAWAFITERETLRGQTTGTCRSTYDNDTNRVIITRDELYTAAERVSVNRYPVDPSFNLSFRLNLDFSKLVDLHAILWKLSGAPKRRPYTRM